MSAGRGLPGGEPWADPRLDNAYRRLAAGPAPEGLTAATLQAVASSRRSRFDRIRFGRPGPRLAGAAWIATVAGVAVVVALVAGLVPRVGPAPASPTPQLRADGLPVSVEGLAVETVGEAVTAEAKGSPPGDDLVAIGGWLTFMPPLFCPYEPPQPVLQEACDSDDLVLTETRQKLVTVTTIGDATTVSDAVPAGPYLYPRQLAGSFVDEPPQAMGPIEAGGIDEVVPVQVVLVGHFHDARAAECAADQRAACESTFVIDQLAWLEGGSQAAAIGSYPGASGGPFSPRLGADGVRTALRPSLDPADSIVSMAAVTNADLTSITGDLQAPGNGADIVWLVRVAGPPPRFPAMAWGAGESGWLIVDDATGRLIGAGGWGFVSAATGTFAPGPQPRSDGLYTLPTVNWLAPTACAGVGLDAVLHGSPTDPRVAWLDNELGSPGRIDVIWPAGYLARFDPSLQILDENGNVVIFEGDRVSGACDVLPSGVYLVPPFS